jgi:predicted RNA binding protein YcfA (HicA-like mRNA interferase family)
MPKLPRLTGARNLFHAGKTGFFDSAQSGSHMIYKNAEGKRATVPFHGSKVVHPKVLKSIIRDAGLSAEDLQKLL